MAITPYVRIPYASERDRYTGRDYTAQQMALMERHAARESAYAQDRAQRMADRWSGVGGLVTETLGGLRQARELDEAQALEQARYDEQLARQAASDTRDIDLYDRAVLRDEVERQLEFIGPGGIVPQGSVDQFRRYNPAMVEDYETPEMEYATLASVAAPERQMGDAAFAALRPFNENMEPRTDEPRPFRFGEPSAPVRDDGVRLPAMQFGPELVAGTKVVPGTSGTRLKMTRAEGAALSATAQARDLVEAQRARSLQAIEVAVETGVFNIQQGRAAASQIGTDGRLSPSDHSLLMKGAAVEDVSYPPTAYASIRDALVQQFVAEHGIDPTGAALEAISREAEALASPDAPTSYLGTTPRNLLLVNGEEVKGAFLVNDPGPGGAHWVGPDMQPIEQEVASVLPPSEGKMAGFPNTLQLRDRWIKESGPAEQSALQFALMRSSLDAAKAGNLAAGSQGILVTFQKILDPGSVVRESEYERSSSGLSLMDQLRGRIQTAIRGGAGVPLSVLEEYVALAGEFAKNQAESTEKHRREIDAIADYYGLPKEFITSKVEFLDEWGLGANSPTFEDRTLGEDIPNLYEVIETFPGYRHVLIPGSTPSYVDEDVPDLRRGLMDFPPPGGFTASPGPGPRLPFGTEQ